MAKAAFKVLRGIADIESGDSTVTITEGVDYTLPTGVDETKAFVRIVNTKLTGMGRMDGGGNQYFDDWTACVQNPGNIATSITFERAETYRNTRIDWEIICYVGESGGNNEFIVRGTGKVATSGAVGSVDGSTISTISDDADVVVFITGQRNAEASLTEFHCCLFVSSLTDEGGGDFSPTFTRGTSTTQVGTVSYAVVEFTGANWSVHRKEWSATPAGATWTSATDAGTGATESIGITLSDLTKSFIADNQYRTDHDPTGLNDAGGTSMLDSTTNLRFWQRAPNANRWKVVWILQNSQAESSCRNLVVQHFHDFEQTGGSEPKTLNKTVTTVDAMDETSIMGASCGTDGAGTDFPRGNINLRLTSTSNVALQWSDTGQEHKYAFEVVQWPEDPIIEDSLDDTVEITEAIDRLMDMRRNINDTVAINESISRLMSMLRSMDETVTVSEAIDRLMAMSRGLDDTETINEVIAYAFPRSIEQGSKVYVTETIPYHLTKSPVKAVLTRGPYLMHVSDTEANIWFQLDGAATVDVKIEEYVGRNDQVQVDSTTDFQGSGRIQNLDPQTVYQYWLEIAGEKLSGPHLFQTMPKQGQPGVFSFIHETDPHLKFNFYQWMYEWTQRWLHTRPLFSVQTGDYEYLSPFDENVTLQEIRDAHKSSRDPSTWPWKQKFRQTVPLYHVWDDWDSYGDNQYGKNTKYDKNFHAMRKQAWREAYMGTPQDADTDGIYYHIFVADCLMIFTDCRTNRDYCPMSLNAPDPPPTYDPDTAECLGSTQMAWLKDLLLTNRDAPFKFIIWGTTFMDNVSQNTLDPDTGARESTGMYYRKERNEIVQFLKDNEITGVYILTGDDHHSSVRHVESWDEPYDAVNDLPSSALVSVEWPITCVKTNNLGTGLVINIPFVDSPWTIWTDQTRLTYGWWFVDTRQDPPILRYECRVLAVRVGLSPEEASDKHEIMYSFWADPVNAYFEPPEDAPGPYVSPTNPVSSYIEGASSPTIWIPTTPAESLIPDWDMELGAAGPWVIGQNGTWEPGRSFNGSQCIRLRARPSQLAVAWIIFDVPLGVSTRLKFWLDFSEANSGTGHKFKMTYADDLLGTPILYEQVWTRYELWQRFGFYGWVELDFGLIVPTKNPQAVEISSFFQALEPAYYPTDNQFYVDNVSFLEAWVLPDEPATPWS